MTAECRRAMSPITDYKPCGDCCRGGTVCDDRTIIGCARKSYYAARIRIFGSDVARVYRARQADISEFKIARNAADAVVARYFAARSCMTTSLPGA